MKKHVKLHYFFLIIYYLFPVAFILILSPILIIINLGLDIFMLLLPLLFLPIIFNISINYLKYLTGCSNIYFFNLIKESYNYEWFYT